MSSKQQECPVCEKKFPMEIIEVHVNKCIFLNTTEKSMINRKRPATPTFGPKFNFNRNKTMEEASTSEINSPKKHKIEINESFVVPLAKQVQPTSIDDFIGQNHVFGENSVLRNLFNKYEIPNMILWGPPGCGKTSLAGVIQSICKSNPTKLKFVNLCAATSNIKQVQDIIEIAKNDLKYKKRTILFMDEIHRFNKRQQDIFLLSVEKGDIVLVGATTENPSFCINNALLSRCRVIVFEKLKEEDIVKILFRAAEKIGIKIIEDVSFISQNTKSTENMYIERSSLVWLASVSDGDARIALSNLQLVIQNNNSTSTIVTLDDIKEGIKKSHMLYDRKGEEHYNTISALHKSIRGSDENASIYWLARLIHSGEDPLYIARRLVRAASEDIGNADPNALTLAVATMQGCHLLGLPECDVLLSQCVIYLARADKCREADTVLAKAKKYVAESAIQPPVPLQIRNAPTKLMRELGYGKKDSTNRNKFLPPEIENIDFFSE